MLLFKTKEEIQYEVCEKDAQTHEIYCIASDTEQLSIASRIREHK